MKILITGGAGFIGNHFIKLMLSKGHNVINLDKLTYAGNLNNLKDVDNNENYTFIKGDICNASVVEKAMACVDTVVHFAAESHVDRSIKEAGSFIQTDVYGTYILLEAAKKIGIQKFVHISTDEVYGQIAKGEFKETDPLLPRNPYSASKAGAEMIARSFFVTHNLPVVITRSSNNFGPNQHPEKLIPRFITNCLRDIKLPVYGDGKQVRDWLFVKDNCEGIELVMEKGKLGEAYNIGGDCEKFNIDITKKILEMTEKDESLIEHVEDRKGHDLRYALDTSKIKQLGWSPKPETFDQKLKETVDWYMNNEWWWKPLVIDN